jgi:dCTP deaminase
MPKSDLWIRKMAARGMIEPFDEGPKRPGTISSGLSSYGYDMRLANEFRVFSPPPSGGIMDPKDFQSAHFTHVTEEACVVPANSFVLARSLEYFRIPRDVLVLCFGKSTYARCGVLVNVTPLEPEWEGFVTISVSNTSPLPSRLHAGEGIAQLVFLGAEEVCAVSYGDRSGKYQAQRDITPPRT